MPILATTPVTTQPATYDKVWFPQIVIQAANINGEPQAAVAFRLYRELEGGGREYAPIAPGQVGIEKLFSLSALHYQDPYPEGAPVTKATSEKIDAAMQVLFAALEAYLKEKGKI